MGEEEGQAELAAQEYVTGLSAHHDAYHAACEGGPAFTQDAVWASDHSVMQRRTILIVGYSGSQARIDSVRPHTSMQ